MIELKDKEIRFYLSILENFLSKLDKNKSIAPQSIVFSDFSNENYRIYHGVSKIVLVPKNRGARYVIKMPIYEMNKRFIDWCEKEAQAYCQAAELGMEKFFAETFFFTDTKKGPVYLQERTIPNYYRDSDSEWYEPYHDFTKLNKDLLSRAEEEEFCIQLLDDLLGYYSNQEVEKLLAFCQEEGINDLHSGNYGYKRGIGIDIPIIFDYSGIY